MMDKKEHRLIVAAKEAKAYAEAFRKMQAALAACATPAPRAPGDGNE